MISSEFSFCCNLINNHMKLLFTGDRDYFIFFLYKIAEMDNFNASFLKVCISIKTFLIDL